MFLQLITITLNTGTISLPGCWSWWPPRPLPHVRCPLLPTALCSPSASLQQPGSVSSCPVCSSFSLTQPMTVTLNSFTKKYSSLAGDTQVTRLLPQLDPTDFSASCAKCVDKRYREMGGECPGWLNVQGNTFG